MAEKLPSGNRYHKSEFFQGFDKFRFPALINRIDPQISLFDIVIMGLIRATILITCYAIFPFKHWLPVAVTTGLTSAFIIIKVGHFRNLSKFKNQVSLNLPGSFKLSINPIHFAFFYNNLYRNFKVNILRFYFSSREPKVNYLNTFSFWLPSPCVGLSCT